MNRVEIYKKILVILENMSIKWYSLDENLRLVIIMSILIVVFAIVYIFTVHVKFSNTGKILWDSISYKYINIQPKEDYMSLLKPENLNDDSTASRKVKIDDQVITIKYITEPEVQQLIDYTGIHKLIDPIKLAEYATKKVNSVLFKNDKIVYQDIALKFNLKTVNEYAGALYSPKENSVIFNWEFIKNMYENTTNQDFIKYYIGLYIHEITHSFVRAKTNEDYEKNIRLIENVCEYIRMISGFQPSTWNIVASNKELPTEKYGAEGAYFLYWVEDKYPGFIKKIIQDRFEKQENEYYQEHTGKSLKDLFRDFQSVL